jgi:hypothetical protein
MRRASASMRCGVAEVTMECTFHDSSTDAMNSCEAAHADCERAPKKAY